MGIDVISLLGGTFTGIVKMMVSDWNERQKLLLRLQFGDIEDARRVKNPFLQYTRRIIALSLIATLILYPVLSAVFQWPLNIPYVQTYGGLFALFKGSASIEWTTFPAGLTFLPMMIPAILYMMGFYFGSGGTRR